MPSENEVNLIPKPLAYIIVLIFIILIIFIGFNIFSGKDDIENELIVIADTVPVTTPGSSGFDEDAALAIFEKKMNILESKNKELEKELKQKEEAFKALISDAKKDLSVQIQELAFEVQEGNRNRINTDYDGLPVGTADDFPEIDFDPNDLTDTNQIITATKQETRHPYGKDYILLSGLKKRWKEIEENDSTSGVFDNIETISNNTDSVARGETKLDDPYVDNSTNRRAQLQSTRTITTDLDVEKIKLTTIPATSFVKVTTLFGVNCPIGGQVVGSDSSIPPRPVVLPIRGTFHGPRGSTFDLGTAHIYGTCAARRTGDNDIGRAEIKIQKISYWDKSGGSQWEGASGAIVDERDNSLDVAGYIDKVKSSNIAKEASAAAILAYSATLSSKEFVQTVGGLSGTSSALTGNELKAAGAQGVTALFKKYADRWENEANSAVDTVIIPAGIPLRFVTDMPIKVKQAADPIELAYDKFYDVLI